MKNKPSILIIDDEICVCSSCDRLFSQAGYMVDTNINPDKGFHQALLNPYDAIILDLKLGDKDGIQLLSDIRMKKPDIPVVIITGYPTPESKRMSKKLGVSDYILKPFNPEEILESVKKITFKELISSIEKTTVHKKADIGSRYYFYHTSWFRSLSDDLVQAGGHLTELSDAGVEYVTMPDVGHIVHRGLPLAEVSLTNKTKRIIPSAVNGKIMAINTKLLEQPYLLEKNVNKINWIAKVQTENLDQDLRLCDTREILFLGKKNIKENDYCKKFTNLGYVTRNINSVEEVLDILAKGEIRVVGINATSFSNQGPEYVKRINLEFPDAKITAFNEPNSLYETQYRRNRLFYYGIDPVSNSEIADVLYCIFDNKKREGSLKTDRLSFLPNSISKIQVMNRFNKKVTLFAFNDVLQNNEGIGYLLINELLGQAYPVEVAHTREKKLLTDLEEIQKITNEKGKSDRIIILQTKDMGKIPGCIEKDVQEYTDRDSASKLLINIMIQPESTLKEEVEFDYQTTIALKDIIKSEMISE
ncbi:MAG: response regulator [Bacteroidales bacterium]|nr:response regulator [Bacteroidales bacterium]